ncbi:MAG: lipoyl(octanoyl) transferase LipB [Deltaproteobacteria bacterium]|nr:MAG: lipoyl(octanoyl) transferase LipB [Deltaproteobacteria bacterium]
MIEVIDLGVISYDEGLKQQQHYFSKKQQTDYLLLLEHTPVFTFGKRDSSEDLLVQEAWLKSQGFDVVKADRGGRVTYHGPGQVVGYLIFSMKHSIPEFVSRVEEVVIQTIAHFNIVGSRDSQHAGVWVGNNKIAAIGLRIERGVTRHGFSLNVSCDLTPYQYVNPCGITDRGITSMMKEMEKEKDGLRPSLTEVKNLLQKYIMGFLQ